MKRIKAACICQTLHFMLKEDIPHEVAVRQVKEDFEKYKTTLDRKCTKYKIVEEIAQSDGSLIVKVIKQSNMSPVGDYLN